MFDVDKFIQCVQNQNAIWEMGAKDYSDRNKKTQSWMNIGCSMYTDWDELENAEKDERGKKIHNYYLNNKFTVNNYNIVCILI